MNELYRESKLPCARDENKIRFTRQRSQYKRSIAEAKKKSWMDYFEQTLNIHTAKQNK